MWLCSQVQQRDWTGAGVWPGGQRRKEVTSMSHLPRPAMHRARGRLSMPGDKLWRQGKSVTKRSQEITVCTITVSNSRCKEKLIQVLHRVGSIRVGFMSHCTLGVYIVWWRMSPRRRYLKPNVATREIIGALLCMESRIFSNLQRNCSYRGNGF